MGHIQTVVQGILTGAFPTERKCTASQTSHKESSSPSGHPFANVLAVYYWSSTYATDRTFAWRGTPSSVGFFFGDNKINDSGVWPVRGGQ